MEINYDLSQIFPDQPIQRLDKSMLLRLNPRKFWAVQKVIDTMGERSTTAQGLKRVLTSYQKTVENEEDQRIYLLWNKHATKENTSIVLGILKVGPKKLYLLDGAGKQQYEEKPLCILDFYVHEDVQRQGNGHKLYDYMLCTEEVAPTRVAIDRPSTAFLQFLEKFYKLKEPVWQNTNFVVYPQFFEDKKTVTRADDNDGFRRSALSDKLAGYSAMPALRSPRSSSRSDSASGIIHGTAPVAGKRDAGPDTPLGRKNARDFGHQSIWDASGQPTTPPSPIPSQETRSVSTSPSLLPEASTLGDTPLAVSPPTFCTELADGYYGNGCNRHFYFCRRGQTQKLLCPAGLFYSLLAPRRCERREDVEACKSQTNDDPTPSTTASAQPFLQILLLPSRTLLHPSAPIPVKTRKTATTSLKNALPTTLVYRPSHRGRLLSGWTPLRWRLLRDPDRTRGCDGKKSIIVPGNLIRNLSNYRMSKEEFEEFYSNKSSYHLVFSTSYELMLTVWDQMGVNEMRRHFHLKQKSLRFDGKNEEESETVDSDNKGSGYFQEKMNIFTTNLLFKFRKEEVDQAERFPEVRQLYRINFEEG